ncbi:hypothetical protein HGRIS_014902 [Hohenbuehelia grisea]|uniref:Uncharacterized protein n=1 Tax=Hohenbuehelia grisea TaxID=104357 RepID=A0ABR3JPK8_9AGAR
MSNFTEEIFYQAFKDPIVRRVATKAALSLVRDLMQEKPGTGINMSTSANPKASSRAVGATSVERLSFRFEVIPKSCTANMSSRLCRKCHKLIGVSQGVLLYGSGRRYAHVECVNPACVDVAPEALEDLQQAESQDDKLWQMPRIFPYEDTNSGEVKCHRTSS